MSDKILVLDLETTWLMGPEALPIEQQPRMVEVGVTVLSKTKGLNVTPRLPQAG